MTRGSNLKDIELTCDEASELAHSRSSWRQRVALQHVMNSGLSDIGYLYSRFRYATPPDIPGYSPAVAAVRSAAAADDLGRSSPPTTDFD